jgi:hypothetical protein
MNQATVSTSIVQPTKSESTNDVKILYRISVQLIGIKKRCRKSDRHFFHFGHMPFGDVNYDDVKQKVRDFVYTNMKQVNSQVRVHLDYVVIKNEGTYTVTQWEPFDAKNIRFDFSL